MIQETFVARTDELSRLNSLLRETKHGHGKLCFIAGEAGAGKTALLSAFSEQALKQYKSLIVAIGSCSSHRGICDPYLPFRELLALLTGDTEGLKGQRITSKENARRLKDFLHVSGQAIVELGPDLIDIFVPGSGIITRAGTFLAEKAGWLESLEKIDKRKRASPQTINKDPSRLIEQYTHVLTALSEKQPLIIAIDDLQWSDPSSLDLLFHLSKRIEDSQILLIGTYRPEEVAIGRDGEAHPLMSILGDLKRYYGDFIIDLDQPEAERRKFVWALVDIEPNKLDDQFRDELLHHTSGHALFTVELLREMRERGDLKKDKDGFWFKKKGFSWEELPSRVEGVIETRLGRLDNDELQTLHVASVEGETFTGEVIAKVQGADSRQLIHQLSAGLSRQHELIIAEGFQKLNTQGISRYRFRHVLFQKYLYSTLDEAECVYLHRAVGNALEGLYGDQSKEISVQLSHHFTQSKDIEKAVHYVLVAGNKAHEASAYREANEAYTKGLELLEDIPEGSNRKLLELLLYLSLGNTLSATEGAADTRVQDAFNNAIEISQEVEDSLQSFIAIRGLSYHHKMRGDYDRSEAFERQLLEIAENLQDPMLLTEAHRLIAESLVTTGAFEPGRDHYEQAAKHYQADLHPRFISMLGSDSGAIAQSQLAYFTWSLGFPDNAISIGEEVLKVARELGHPFSLAITLDTVSALYHQLRDPQACLDIAQECSDLSTEYGFAMWNARAHMRQGWALAMLEQISDGVNLIEKGLETYKALGFEVSMPCMFALLAEALFVAGKFEDGRRLTSQALKTINQLNERYCEVEVLRIRGDCLSMEGDIVGAESEYRSAIKVAQSQKAKSLELRAKHHLVKLLLKHDHPERDLALLKQTYEWFQEGFETADLREVKDLLEQH